MRELLDMYRSPRMIKLTAFCAATFAFFSVVFKNGIVLIPEISEVRPVNALPLAYGLLFGPAGAMGCALGNLIGDFSGSLTALSVAGFLGNFLCAYLPYKIWDAFAAPDEGRPTRHASRLVLRLALAIVVPLVACAATLGVSFEWYGVMAARSTFNMIFLNNLSATIVLGLPLLFIITCIVPKAYIPYWKDLMADHEYGDMTPAGKRNIFIASGLSVLGLLAIAVADAIGMSGGEAFVYDGALGDTWPVLAMAGCLLAVIALSLNGRYVRKKG